MKKSSFINPLIHISWGELFDRLSILKIKKEHMKDHHKDISFLEREIYQFQEWSEACPKKESIQNLYKKLSEVNSRLWIVEDALRESEKESLFDECFISLARSVYQLNDQRHKLKREIDLLTQSLFREEKCYNI